MPFVYSEGHCVCSILLIKEFFFSFSTGSTVSTADIGYRIANILLLLQQFHKTLQNLTET